MSAWPWRKKSDESKSSKLWIADLVKRVAQSKLSDAQAGICAYDCLIQWEVGGVKLLTKTIQVWNQRLDDVEASDASRTDTERHGVWVPSIPLEA